VKKANCDQVLVAFPCTQDMKALVVEESLGSTTLKL
jgi:hypothetical protein